jgi:hypothetical protein
MKTPPTNQRANPHHLQADVERLTSLFAIPASVGLIIPPVLTEHQALVLLESFLRKLKLRLQRIEISERGRIVAVVSKPLKNQGFERIVAANHLPTFPPAHSALPTRHVEERIELFAMAAPASPQIAVSSHKIEPSSPVDFKLQPPSGKPKTKGHKET